MRKKALLDRLVRLGATDIPNTPRWLMKHRSPEELAALQHGVAGAFGKLEAPAKKGLEKALSVLPEGGRAQKALRMGGHMLIENPEILPMQAVPIPGLTPAYMGLKKGLEKAIDRFAPNPMQLQKAAFSESQYSGGTAAKFIKQESDMPPFRRPSLQPVKLAAGAPTRGGFMMASDMPPWHQPPLDKYSGDAPPPKNGKEKDGDMVAGYMGYGPGDFKQVDINKKHAFAMSTEELGEFVSMLKEAATPLGGSSVAMHAAVAKRVGAPQIHAPKGTGVGIHGKTPSISAQIKPPGFGKPLPGAVQNGIGAGPSAPVKPPSVGGKLGV